MTDYRAYQPQETSRVRENIEWSISYSFNARDTQSPRVLLIGDSICNGYQTAVREKLGDKVNITYWASSKCVTDPDYFRELDFVLGAYPYQMVTFNNGLHSLTTNRTEWEQAYAKAVQFIRAKLPDAALSLVLSTPVNDDQKVKICMELNEIVLDLAKREQLPVVDLFAAMDPLDRKIYWVDAYHFTPEAIQLQAELLAEHILSRLNLTEGEGSLVQEGTFTGPDGAMQ